MPWTYVLPIQALPAEWVTGFLSFCILSLAWAAHRDASQRIQRRFLAVLSLSAPLSLIFATGLASILHLTPETLAGPSALSGAALALMLGARPVRGRGDRRQWAAVAFAHGICHGLGSTGSFLLLVAGAVAGILSMFCVRSLRGILRKARLWILDLEIRRDARIRDRVDDLLGRISRVLAALLRIGWHVF